MYKRINACYSYAQICNLIIKLTKNVKSEYRDKLLKESYQQGEKWYIKNVERFIALLNDYETKDICYSEENMKIYIRGRLALIKLIYDEVENNEYYFEMPEDVKKVLIRFLIRDKMEEISNLLGVEFFLITENVVENYKNRTDEIFEFCN